MKYFQTKFRYALLCAGLMALLTTSVFADFAYNFVDSTGDVGRYTSLVLNGSGFPVISYFDGTNGDLKVAVCSDAACVAKTVTTVDNAGVVGQYTSLKLNSSGFPVISYYDQSNGNLKLAICGNATCSSGNTLTIVDSTDDVGLYTSLALNSSGFPVISYYDQTKGDLNIAICGNAICSSGNTLISLDWEETETVGLYTSLALNSGNIPVISYYDQTNGNLRVAACSEPMCTGGTVFFVPSTGDEGQYTSLALNSSGFPVISYYDQTNGNLKLFICTTTTCSDGAVSTIDSSTDNVGQYTSLVLKSGNIPVISYYDITNGDLKVATCSNADCTGGVPISPFWSSAESGQYTSLALNSTGQFKFVSYYVAGVHGDLELSTDTPINPWVNKITRNSANPTSASSVEFRVYFSENVFGVDENDFVLTTTGSITGAGITGISGAGSDRFVTVNTGSGSGTIRLDVVDNDSIVDQNLPSPFPLGGSGPGNGSFSSGETYSVRPLKLFLPLIRR